MGGQTLNHWIKIGITLKHKETLATKTVYFTNRPEIGSSDVDNDHWPLIESISRLGVGSDRESVLPEAGNFRLYNYLGSFGVERKFTDLLEKYAIVSQPITIQHCQTVASDYEPLSYTTYYNGTVDNWRVIADDEMPTMDISFDVRPFQKRYLGKKITPGEFTQAEEKDLFKYLPIVFSESDEPVQVRPILVSKTIGETVNVTTGVYAYASTYGTQFTNGGVQTIYAKDYDGIFREVRSPSVLGDYVFGDNTGGTGIVFIGNKEVAYFVDHDPATHNYVMTHVDVTFKGQGVARTHSGTLTIRIYEAIANDSTNGLGRVLATGSRPIDDYDSNFDSSDYFTIRFGLNKPLVMAGNLGYFLSFVADVDTGVATDEIYIARQSASSTGWFKATTPSYIYFTSSFSPVFGFLAAKFTDTATPTANEVDAEGWGHSFVTVTENATTTGWEEPDITLPEYIFGIDGLRDNSGGTITGTSNLGLVHTHHALELLQYEWNGSTWVDSGKWNFSQYSDTHVNAESGDYVRGIRGTTKGGTTHEELARELCKNTAYRIIMLKNGKLAVYGWGLPQSAVSEFHQENSKLVSYAELDPSYVLNRIKIAGFSTILSDDPIRLVVEGIPAQYQLYSDWDIATEPTVTEIVGNSVSLYGERVNREQIFDWIATANGIEVLQKYFLTNYGHPPVYVTIESEIGELASLEPMSVIDIKLPSLPAFYGTSPKAKIPSVDGEEIELAYNLTRAQRYRAQVEGMYIQFQSDDTPRVVLNTRLLLNEMDPT